MKLVREHIFEKFSEEGDPIKDLGVGLIKRYYELINLVEMLGMNLSVDFSQIDHDKDELTIRTDTDDILYIRDTTYRSQKGNWEEVGVFNNFLLEYYLDFILPKNKLIRSFHLTNIDIEGFDYWDTRILCDNILETSDDDISSMIDDDYNSIDSSNALSAGLEEAWDIADDNYDKNQKRIRN